LPLAKGGHSRSNELTRGHELITAVCKIALSSEWRHDPGMKGVFEISSASRYDDLLYG
jgi:hypothetical protein